MIAVDALKGLDDIVYKQASVLKTERIARACVATMHDCLRSLFSSQMIYVPVFNRQDRLQKQQLYNSIYQEFNGSNRQYVVLKHGLSEMAIYKIVDRQKNMTIAKVQDDIFPLESYDDRPFLFVFFQDYLPPEFVRKSIIQQDSVRISLLLLDYLLSTYPGLCINIVKAIRLQQAGVKGSQTELF